MDADKMNRTDYIQGALVAIENSTGYIRAMIGGRDFYQSKFNRAIQAKRQPGSSFKPFVYTAAIDNGITAGDIVLDTPIVIDQGTKKGSVWTPENYDRTFRGPTSVRTGLMLSRNIISVKLMQKVGIYTVIDYAKRMGIKSDIQPYLSLALGSSEVTPLEIVNAYCTFPNLGEKVEPITITRIEDRNGNVIEENNVYKERVISPQTAYVMVDMMEGVVNHGTGAASRTMGFYRPAGGKTGTTNDYTDAWFIGYTPQITCGTWVGFDQKKRIGAGMAGGVVALPIWTRFMKDVTGDMPEEDFQMPEGIIVRNICKDTGLLSTEFCPEPRDEIYISGTEPTSECYLHHDITLSPNFYQGHSNFEEEDKRSIRSYHQEF
jgi:penicillin-binding protein 1A